MGKKILVACLSLILAFALGCGLGFGYYYFSAGSPMVSATPLSPSPPEVEEEPEALPEHLGGAPEVPARPEAAVEETEAETGEIPPEGQEPPVAPAVPAPEAEGALEPVPKFAYITIDDGPDPVNTPAILSILDQYNVKASFFVLGASAEKYPELIRLIHDKGHAVGNHTYNHVYHETYASDESFWESVKKTEEILYQLLAYRPTLLREPGGRFRTDPEKQRGIREQGYDLVYWNVDSYDSRSPIPDKDTILANVVRQAQKEHLWPAMVLLFHESGGHGSTVEALPLVIEYLLQEGFTLRTLAEMDKAVMADLPKP